MLLAAADQQGLSPRVRGNRDDPPRRAAEVGSIPAGAGEPRPCRSWSTARKVYPRGCGGTVVREIAARAIEGLSPRVRGNLAETYENDAWVRSIPAGAGEPIRTRLRTPPRRVYPRGCGGTFLPALARRSHVGLSPRVRGNQCKYRRHASRARSIPAGAGEPQTGPHWREDRRVYPRGCGGTRSSMSPAWRSQVYPRGCGGTSRFACRAKVDTGLSPRVRGNPLRIAGVSPVIGSIPAGAGEPSGAWTCPAARRVYPRGCGGTRSAARGPRLRQGLSPRVRGNRGRGLQEHDAAGSIPAGAGEPHSPAGKTVAARSIPAGAGEPTLPDGTVVEFTVYPRGCGGTRSLRRLWRMATGLSPRVRGNPGLDLGEVTEGGSIPAGAGEPGSSRSRSGRSQVYPRGCGGTHGCPSNMSIWQGLSPRVRGNHDAPLAAAHPPWSIPAGAGEPGRRGRIRTRGEVYPRGCGGTSGIAPTPDKMWGLSPRVRGNRRRVDEQPPSDRSIPAGAGEPFREAISSRSSEVYPRGCGGTATGLNYAAAVEGLSPRVRGNRLRGVGGEARLGSIPAGAGEPRPAGSPRMPPRVYPRGCGGTRRRHGAGVDSDGLSPRVRGNRRGSGQAGADRGSIPAGAGEPMSTSHPAASSQVYPRGCGGTMAGDGRS